jgi:multimeric flavodoxin WrbA
LYFYIVDYVTINDLGRKNDMNTKILILNGSPRKNGNTEHLTKMVSDGLTQAGADVQQFRLADLNIHPCIGCGNCEAKGLCIFDDDMQMLYKHIADADIIILASPIYFYGLTAQLKSCIDRCQALWSRKYILKKPVSTRKNRKGYLISVAASSGKKVFEGAILTARYGLDAMDVPYRGALLYAGVDTKGAITKHPDYPDSTSIFIQQLLQH